jgi:mono/diheme cytochrome c family protein
MLAWLRFSACGLCLAAAFCAAGMAGEPAARRATAPAEAVRYETDVRPIFKAHCFHCHGEEEKPKAALDLRLVRSMLAGGESGPAIAAGSPADSLVYQRVMAGEMPPGKKKLSAGELATVARWIEQGARTVRPEPENTAAAQWTDEERAFWSFQPVRRPPLPRVKQPQLVRRPIDAFLLAALEQRGLSFSPATDPRTLVRRLSFDLTGLPPTPAMVERFVADAQSPARSADAYERLVDELLASPAYGERWARHWLDVAGYADSDGYTEKDAERPWAFRYRDYVIRSLNADKPLDQFIVEQLAGDELLTPPYRNLDSEDADQLIATGFLRTAPDGTADGGVDQNMARNDVMAETLKIVTTSLLGLTVGCAQCHNHRYDPISQVDYYRLRAIFEPAIDWKSWRPPSARLVSLWTAADQQQASAADAELQAVNERRQAEMREIVADIFAKEVAKLDPASQALARAARDASAAKRTPEQQQILKDHPSLNVSAGSAYLYEPKRVQDFNKRYDDLAAQARAKRPADNYVACLTEVPGRAPPTHLFARGDHQQPREQVSPGDLSVLGDLGAKIAPDDPQLPTSGRRLALARHLTSGRHPLVARVLVNRIWMHHFGRGLVATPGDFGALGSRPTHPELLDWLADELVRGGWQLKRLHRLIVTSAAYRQSSVRTPALEAIDPENRLLGRMNVRRLETEAIRDSLIAVSGDRVATMYGPAIAVNPDEVGQIIIGRATRDGNGIMVAKTEHSDDIFRRTVYVQVRRTMPLGMLEPFDVASTAPNCELRTSSTVASQGLMMLNHEAVVQQSYRFARRVMAEAGDDPAQQVSRAWLLAYGQAPATADVTEGVEFLKSQRDAFEQTVKPNAKSGAEANPTERALATLCQALFCSNRFLYVD